VHPDGQVVHDTDRHARCRRACASATCWSAIHCSHTWNATRSARRVRSSATSEADVVDLGRPLATEVVLLERAPQGEVLQRLSLARGEGIELGAARRRQRHREDRVEAESLRGPDRVAIDAVRVVIHRGDGARAASTTARSVGVR
jgi:hypothetical protein